MQALGLIETRGFTSAVEALDVAVKTANVALLGIEFIGSGLVTIQITGDVSAVKVSVDAAVISARKVGEVVAAHVIPRPFDDLAVILKTREIFEEKPGELDEEPESEPGLEAEGNADPEPESEPGLEAEGNVDSEPELEVDLKIEIPEFEIPNQETLEKSKGVEDFVRYTEEELGKMKVVDLRTLIRGLPGLKIKRNQIKFMNKEELLIAIQAFYQQFNTNIDI